MSTELSSKQDRDERDFNRQKRKRANDFVSSMTKRRNIELEQEFQAEKLFDSEPCPSSVSGRARDDHDHDYG